ncbi:Hypothetical predicted protein [Olea europaea subsp. europaea]|uniref:Uncharacterized protein n=1 Tax=Olea europaea subsp. europaea TaxID=158383 RepID=A0A8S0PQW3_OLEEU|nr:Hypothetical predicted protein [Olea europaea subsp. europaea]
MEIDDVKAQFLSIKADRSHKLNIVVCTEENINTDLMEIKSELKFLSNFMTAMVTSSMDQIVNRFKEIGKNVGESVDRKGKGKKYPDVQTFDLMNVELPSFDLGIYYTEPTPNVCNTPDMLQSDQLQEQIDTVISRIVMDSKVAHQKVFPTSARSSGLPLKRVSRVVRYYSPHSFLTKGNRARARTIL